MSEKKYVVLYDNGSGWMEWASLAQDSREAAIEAAKQAFGGTIPPYGYGSERCLIREVMSGKEEYL